MSQIRIYLDGTYESLSAAKPKTAQDHKARVAVLKKDLTIAKKIAKQHEALAKIRTLQARLKAAQKTPANAKKADALKVKAASIRSVMSGLKGQLSSVRHAKLEVIERVYQAADNDKVRHADGAKAAKQKAKDDRPYTKKELRAEIAKIEERLSKRIVPGPNGSAAKIKKSLETQLAGLKKELDHGLNPHSKAAKDPVTTNSNAAKLKAAGVKLAALDAGAKRNVNALLGMKNHQEMASAVAKGQATPHGMGNSSTVRNAGKLIAAHLKPAERDKIEKISEQHETALQKIRNTHGSPAREQKLNQRTQKKLNDSGVFESNFDSPHAVINLINGITSVK